MHPNPIHFPVLSGSPFTLTTVLQPYPPKKEEKKEKKKYQVQLVLPIYSLERVHLLVGCLPLKEN